MNNSDVFLRRLVDTLLPGLPATGDKAALPAAATLDLHLQLATHLETHPAREKLASALRTIAAAAGNAENFAALDEAQAVAILATVEKEHNALFLALLDLVAADYYEHPKVLTAFGWRPTPPQPEGYPLDSLDEALLDEVGRRGPIWRPVD